MQKEQTITLCRHFLSIIVRSEDIHKPYDQIFGYFGPPPLPVLQDVQYAAERGIFLAYVKV